MSDQPPTRGKTSALLGDLESIRSLLAEAEAAGGPQPESDDEVPLLEDVVQGGVSVNEAFLAGEGAFEESGNASGLDDAIFKALLSDQWRETAREVLDEAHRVSDTPNARPNDGADTLNAAIMARIDDTLQRWLRQAVLNGIDDLRRELLASVRSQLGEVGAAQFKETSPEEDLDGA